MAEPDYGAGLGLPPRPQRFSTRPAPTRTPDFGPKQLPPPSAEGDEASGKSATKAAWPEAAAPAPRPLFGAAYKLKGGKRAAPAKKSEEPPPKVLGWYDGGHFAPGSGGTALPRGQSTRSARIEGSRI